MMLKEGVLLSRVSSSGKNLNKVINMWAYIAHQVPGE